MHKKVQQSMKFVRYEAVLPALIKHAIKRKKLVERKHGGY